MSDTQNHAAGVARDLPEAPFVAIFTIDVFPEHRDRFLNEMAAAMAHSAREPGVASFTLLADRDDPNRFTAVDVYTDRAGYEAHLTSPQTPRLIQALEGCLRGPPQGTFHHQLATKESCLAGG